MTQNIIGIGSREMASVISKRNEFRVFLQLFSFMTSVDWKKYLSFFVDSISSETFLKNRIPLIEKEISLHKSINM